MRSFFGLGAVYVLGLAFLWWMLEGPALPFGSGVALFIFLLPGLVTGWARGSMSTTGWLLYAVTSFGLVALSLALAICLLGFGFAPVVLVLLALSVAGWSLGQSRRRRLIASTTDPTGDFRLVVPLAGRLYRSVLPAWTASWPLGLCALVAAITVLWPYALIGSARPEGLAFRTFFDHDTLVHLAVVSELGKGIFPPMNPYFAGEVLHYYWLYFLYPALAGKLSFGFCSPLNALIFCNYSIVLLFCATLYTFLYTIVLRPVGAMLLSWLTLFAGSFEGLYVLLCAASAKGGALAGLIRVRGPMPSLVSEYNVDAVTRWHFAPPQIDTLYRGLLYTPQHLVGLCSLLFLGLLLSYREARPVSVGLFLLLLPLVGVSGFIGVIGICWVLVLVALGILAGEAGRWRKLLVTVLGACFLGVLVYHCLGMFGGSERFVTVLPRPRTWKSLFLLLFLNFGAIGMLGALGVGLAFWRRSRVSGLMGGSAMALFFLLYYAAGKGVFAEWGVVGVAIYLAALSAVGVGVLISVRERYRGARDHLVLFFIAMAAIFSGYIPGYVNEFGLRGGFVAALCLGAFVAGLWRFADSWGRGARTALAVVTVFLAVLSLPTTAIDWYNAQNLQNKRFITYVSPREAEALAWVRHNLRETAVVQGLPDRVQNGRWGERGRGFIGNFINSIGGRRMAVGKTYYAGQFQIGEDRARRRVRRVNRIFKAGSLRWRLEPLLRYGIDYLFVGQYERAMKRADPGLFTANPQFFEPVFDNEEVQIFRVRQYFVSGWLKRPAAHGRPSGKKANLGGRKGPLGKGRAKGRSSPMQPVLRQEGGTQPEAK